MMLAAVIFGCSVTAASARGRVPLQIETPQENCCPTDKACCGDSCIPFDDLAFTTCPFDSNCCGPDCICIEIFKPVCGVDGVTYDNECYLDCAGVELASEGPCDCICIEIFQPVCGVDGVTYDNECYLDCAGVKLASEGPCECDCPENYEPVCGEDGVTYSNACFLKCAGVGLANEGPCEVVDDCCPAGEFCCDTGCLADGTATLVPCGPSRCCGADCICPAVFQPVCGVDGVTYSNECFLNCAGVDLASEGPCETVDDCCSDGTTCCGDRCIDDEELPITLCPVDGDCCNPEPSCEDACPNNVQPVCGEDGVTYPTECHAECAGVAVVSQGECEPIDDCCPEEQACCGQECIPEEELPFTLCPAFGPTCCDPSPPPDDCCPKGEFCCGTGCLPDSQAPFVRCAPVDGGCCDDPHACCGKGKLCCGEKCVPEDEYNSSRSCPMKEPVCCKSE